MNKLVEILPSDWSILRDLFIDNWPKNIVGYFLVENYIQWHNKNEQINIKNLKFYSLNNSWDDGTFIIIDRYQLFVYSLQESNERLKLALTLVDWSNGLKVSSFLARHRSAILHVVESKKLQIEYDSTTDLYYYPKKDAHKLDLSLPCGFYLKSLSTEHATIIDNAWPNKHVASDFLVTRLIKWNPNIGIFNTDNELMAWCLRLQAGALGALQTHENHQRKGLGTLVTKAMVQQLSKMDQDTFAFVGINNTASQNMFNTIGFKKIDQIYWLRTLPTNKCEFEWID